MQKTILAITNFAMFAVVLPCSDGAEPNSRFADPPSRFRILKIIHNLPASPTEQDHLLKTLTAQGFGGIVTNVPWTNYLQGEPEWQVFLRTVREAKRAGMALWLYDEHGYPSGVAFGQTLKDRPEWEAHGLLVADEVTAGGRIVLPLPPGKLVRACAVPVVEGRLSLETGIDLFDRVKDGKLTWDAPKGDWHAMAITEDRLYQGTHAAVSLCDKLPYINLLCPEPTAKFLQLTHEAYAKRLGPDLGQSFVGVFTDEPSLMSLYMRPMPYRPLPWSAQFPNEFRKRRGYALEPLLPALVADAGARGARARYDYWLTIAELVSQNYFGQIRDWCRRHQIPSGGHLLLEEPLLMHVPLYGDLFRCERLLDAPSLDCLTSLPSQVHWYSARLVSSAAELEGRPDTMCETSDHSQRHRPHGDTRPPQIVTEGEIRGTCNRLILNGMTCITSYYSFHGLNDDQLKRLNLWVGRCCGMLYGGRQVTDLAVLYPIESVWPRFSPSRHGTQDAKAAMSVALSYHQTAEQLFTHGRDFTFIDARTLSDANATGGVLRYRDLAWRAVILPGVDTLPMSAWETLARFWRTGGVVIAVGARPANSSTEFPCAAVQAIGEEMFGDSAALCRVNANGGAAVFLPTGRESRISPVLSTILEPDVRPQSSGSPLRITHRRIDGREVFFLINDSPSKWKGCVDVNATGPGELFDPGAGTVALLAGPDRIELDLGPYSGVLLRFERHGTAGRRRTTLEELSAATR